MHKNFDESSSSLSTLSSPLALTPSPTCCKSTSNKLDFLYELSYVPNENKITSDSLPLLNPYQPFTKTPSSFTRSIKALIKPSFKAPKEYIQASKFSQCQLAPTPEVQFVTLEIPPELPPQWMAQGYTHIHFGAIRLALNYHGRKGLPVSARIGLLDTRMRKYQHASIATIETTLNAGTVVVTLFPNFNMSLRDNRLTDAFKVEVQTVGVDQDPTSLGATLHYQMAYRLQDHALDLNIPQTQDALLISVDSKQVPTCTHVPKQMTTEELTKLLPKSWVTNYEKLHKPQHVVQTTTEPSYHTKEDGSVEIIFDRSQTTTPSCFHTQYVITPIHPIDAEILYFDSQGKPIYAFESSDGHKYWDVCNCKSCLKDDEPSPRPTPGKRLKKKLEKGDKTIGLLGQPSGKFDYIVKYSAPKSYNQPMPEPTGWDSNDASQDLQPVIVLPCYKRQAKWMKKHGEKFPTPTVQQSHSGVSESLHCSNAQRDSELNSSSVEKIDSMSFSLRDIPVEHEDSEGHLMSKSRLLQTLPRGTSSSEVSESLDSSLVPESWDSLLVSESWDQVSEFSSWSEEED
ncbi:hypothetical protein G4B88_010328 [Cannabis sativa]|uniref:Uncharacterized protein n=1 Tax=Cannabis sativa TaxID=3483 RepID=A0A7J6I6E3_CANSA|nr:hypothetical protein G4B88_010328 [Cannabis sativa]